MKNSSLIFAILLLPFSLTSFANVSVTDSKNGAWVKVTENGLPSTGAVIHVENIPQITKSFTTDDNGRVFIPISLNHSTSIKYKAITSNGKVFSDTEFHSAGK